MKVPVVTTSMFTARNVLNGNEKDVDCSTSDTVLGKGICIKNPSDIEGIERGKSDVCKPVAGRDFDVIQTRPSMEIQSAAYPSKNNQVPPKKSTSGNHTSLQFFVSSEDGINLYVDLSSSPETWISSLKSEVCIDHELHASMLPSGNGEPMKSLIGVPCIGVKNSMVDKKLDILHGKTCLESLRGENSLSVPSHDSIVIEIPEPSEQNNSGISSSDILQEETVCLDDCMYDSDANLNMEAMEPHIPDLSQSLATADTEVPDAHSRSISTMVSGISEKLEDFADMPLYIAPHRTQNVAPQEELSSVSLEMQLPGFIPEGGIGASVGLSPQLGTIKLQNVALKSNKLGIGEFSLNEQDQSQYQIIKDSCSRMGYSSSQTSKRTYGSGFPEELSNKKRLNNGEACTTDSHTASTFKNLESVKDLAGENLLPRRSKRLGSK